MLYYRWISCRLSQSLERPYVHILFGARQTGKSTLLKELIPANALRFNLADPQERSRLLAYPGIFSSACMALPHSPHPQTVFVDEAQTVPALFDAVQFLYDEDKSRWRFVLCGSSARKLRRAGANLLPGRSFLHGLHPLTLIERPAPESVPPKDRLLPLAETKDTKPHFPTASLEDRLTYGDLPGVTIAEPQDKAEILKAYSTIYLEEEIRREALVKDWGAFVRFLQLAAAESGQILNYSAISQEAGVSLPTVKSYYQLLEDMFVGIRIPAYSKSRRKNVLSTPKFLLFDLGVRHAASGITPSIDIVKADPGRYFEQWVGLELWRRLQYLGEGKLHHQRTKDGAEVDYIVEFKGKLIPIEVKWTEHPSLSDARHMVTFLNENSKNAKQGYVICRSPRRLALSDQITALPWWLL